MEQFEFFEITNPCIGVCKNGPRGLCLGCYRSRDERQYWNHLNDDAKRQIVQVCALRKRRAQHRAQPDETDEDLPPQQDLF